MSLLRILFPVLLLQVFLGTSAIAGDFSWLKELNIRAQSDGSGFRTTLATRFKIGNAEINAVLSNVDRPADAYMVLRLGELSHRSTDYVLEHYKSDRHKGWGALAKDLGIKPGSREFHALKAGHDLRDGGDHHHSSSKQNKNHHGKQNSNGKGKNK